MIYINYKWHKRVYIHRSLSHVPVTRCASSGVLWGRRKQDIGPVCAASARLASPYADTFALALPGFCRKTVQWLNARCPNMAKSASSQLGRAGAVLVCYRCRVHILIYHLTLSELFTAHQTFVERTSNALTDLLGFVVVVCVFVCLLACLLACLLF